MRHPLFDPVTPSALQYRWTLCYSMQGPSGGNPASGPATWNPDPVGGWSSTPHSNPTRLWFNLEPEPSPSPFGNVAMPTTYQVIRNAAGVPSFHFSLPEAEGPIFGQILVEQLRVSSTGTVSTGNWAASRGFWFGVLP